MLAWWAEKPSSTSSLVRPFTSLEAVQSSRTISTLAPSKTKLALFSQFRFVLLADDHEKPRISFSEAEKRLVLGERREDECDVIEFATKRATELVHVRLRFA